MQLRYCPFKLYENMGCTAHLSCRWNKLEEAPAFLQSSIGIASTPSHPPQAVTTASSCLPVFLLSVYRTVAGTRYSLSSQAEERVGVEPNRMIAKKR
jgi:hypothetical protein